MEQQDHIKEATMPEVVDDRYVARLVFGEKTKKTSWRTVQQWARNGLIKGRKAGYSWKFHRDAVRDFLMGK